jgi:hypothetical protein
MGFADRYIEKNRGEFFFEPTKFLPFKMVVVIPCFNEPEIRYTLSSLFDCDHPGVDAGIVVVVNSTENSTEDILVQNRKTVNELNALSVSTNTQFLLNVIDVKNLPEKHGGVGWARKIGMDWAIAHFNQFGNDGGIIVSLDADTLVEKKYLNSILEYFTEHSGKVAGTINFEHTFHPSDLRTEVLEEASVLYELYMRYYRNASLYTGFPYSFYTVGSCFAVKAGAYVAQGGMNRRKAGEDFYFLHKVAMLGEIGEINSTTVYPSSRLSNRVPFGTGPILQKYNEGNHSIRNTYPLESFEILKHFFLNIEEYFNLGDNLRSEDLSIDISFNRFCNEIKLPDQIRELKANCGSVEIFTKRFFHLFNAFKVLKWMNYSILHRSPQKELINECFKLLQKMGIDKEIIPTEPKLILNLFRSLDKNRIIN